MRPKVNDELVSRVGRGLTERDRLICSTLYEHRVLTTPQVADLAFDSPERARQRLVVLYRYHVVDRFRPFRSSGSAPFHYVLDEMGAMVAAAELGKDPDIAFRSERTLAWARSQRLKHLVGVNGFFTSLVRAGRASGGTATLAEWWSERRCARAMGGLVLPDGYGVWQESGTRVEFCLEYDRGTEPLGRLVAKLAGYRNLAEASGVRRWVLIVVPTTRRESEVRRTFERTFVPVATTSGSAATDPAAAVWLPVGQEGPRVGLARLGRSKAAEYEIGGSP